MAYTSNDTRAQGTTTSNFFSGLVAKLMLARARRAAYLVTYHELSSMSDRELSDIAVNRYQIRDIARAAANDVTL